jgi:hypothetical protein
MDFERGQEYPQEEHIKRQVRSLEKYFKTSYLYEFAYILKLRRTQIENLTNQFRNNILNIKENLWTLTPRRGR